MSRIAKAATVALGTGAVVLSGAAMAQADSGAKGSAVHSPGVVSGNVIQAPIHVPVNVCGNTVDVIGALNPAFGNYCVNED
ncbi:chaplin [Streptomyces sp. SBST2-5]|uniref:Chaplin n=1 Tax=Streptomyces composti TaxID=2720025 RepID=A0ABX1AHL4_9ACTN|nr:chaplin [Streptomyces composti]NJP53354.1 chaplin [Streptomyces composti]